MENKVLVLLANKIDLKQDRAFNEETGRKLAEDSNMKYFEISARYDEPKIINNLFEEIAKESLELKGKERKNEKEGEEEENEKEDEKENENEQEEKEENVNVQEENVNVNEEENGRERREDIDGLSYPCYYF